LYIGPYTAWHLSTPSDSASPTEQGAVFGTYRAVIRFGTPLYTPAGAFDGVLLLTLDARHLMEQIIHIVPGTAHERAVWPNYATGNYTYMWDSTGWLVAHPVFARIRGLDPTGQEIPTFMNATPKVERSLHPFHMQSDANPDAPRMYAATQAGQIGYQSNRSQGGVLKANVYAPIVCHYGPYAGTGIFGGLVIGANLDQFHAPANIVRAGIEAQRDRLQIGTLWLAGLVVVLLGAFSFWLARSITRPIARLTQAARTMEKGELDTAHLNQVINRRFGDEVSKLAEVFQTMARQVQLREQQLKEQIVEMRIQIDEQKMAQQVREVTDTDYFRNLQANAQSMRARTHRLRESATPTPAGTTDGSEP
jgi:HAMP domain-containing protein